MPESTDQPRQTPPPAGGHAARYISAQPWWADETRIEGDSIIHSWRAPTVARVLEPGEGSTPATVELYRYDDLTVFPDGVVLEEGPWWVMVLDARIEDPREARKLAQAIVECCDRIEGAPTRTE